MKLDKLFNPKTIAVIGASNEKGTVGYFLFKNLISSDYEGIVYPINIKRSSVQSIKAYPSIKDLPDKIDLAIIATPAKTVPGIIKECGEAGVGGAVIIFASQMALPGKIAFISQSGALCTAILDWSVKNNVGFSHFVSIGSMLDVGFHDLIDHFGQDPEVSSILIYMESLNNARKFLSAARAFSKGKPIIVLKVGRSNEGAKAAKSHTGSLAGNNAVFDAAFERAGIVRVNTVVGLFHTAKALAMQPRPLSAKMVVVTNAGGAGVIATDSLIYSGGSLASLSKKTIVKLNKILPNAWSHNNPVDILGDAESMRYKKTVEVCLRDENVDSILIILTPQAMTDPTSVAREIVVISKNNNKPIFACWMGGNTVAEGRSVLEQGSVPVYRSPEDAITCFMNVYNYSKNLKLLHETPSTIPHAFTPKIKENKKLILEVANSGRDTLTEAESKKLLDNYDIPVVKHAIAKDAKEAGKLASKIGFPVVMKILSPDILHKTDVGGVKLDINSEEEAQHAFEKIINSVRKHKPKADIHGVFIEGMVNKKYELLIGCKKDPIFGPAIVFGMGGVAVEVFKDTKVGLPPLNMALSMRMINETKISKLLKGYRNMTGIDIQAIQFLLYKFAYLIIDFPEIKEIDINPFAVDENGGIVLDAKVILDKEVMKKEIIPYSHLVISPYPKEYITQFKMKNKKLVIIRPIRPEDEPLERELFKIFSKETQRHRFFHLIKDISHELLQRYTHIDYDREIALIAELTERKRKKIIGVVRLISDPYNESAEFATVIGDPWQYQGLGNKFTDYILEIAKSRGLKRVYAKFYKDNNPIISIFKKRGFEISFKGDTGYAELSL